MPTNLLSANGGNHFKLVHNSTCNLLQVQELAQVPTKVRFSERFDDFIEFEVEMSEIPVNDNIGKDVTVNWKFYDNF